MTYTSKTSMHTCHDLKLSSQNLVISKEFSFQVTKLFLSVCILCMSVWQLVRQMMCEGVRLS